MCVIFMGDGGASYYVLLEYYIFFVGLHNRFLVRMDVCYYTVQLVDNSIIVYLCLFK